MDTSSNPYYSIIQSHPEYANKGGLLGPMGTNGFNTPNSEYFGAGSIIDPSTIKSPYYAQAYNDYAPYYGGTIAQGTRTAEQDVANTENQYQNQIAQLNNQLGVDTRNLNNTEGENGTWGASARAQRMNSLTANYGAQFNNAFNTAKDALERSRINSEYNLGTSNLPDMPVLNRYSVGPNNGYQAQAQAAGYYKYNPFQYAGQLPTQHITEAMNLGNQRLQAQFTNPFKGLGQ